MTRANRATLCLCWLVLVFLGANGALADSSLDFELAGEYATQFHGGPYSEAAGSGLGGSIALTLANGNVASFDGTQSESLAANAFTNGARFTVGAFFKMSSLAAGSTNRGILRLGLSNGGTDNFTGLPFASIMLDSSGASFLAYRSGAGSEPVDDATFTLATNQWYYFESTFTRSGDTGTTLIDYSITLANAAADGTIGSVIETYSPSSSTGHQAASTALNGAIYGAFKGHDAFPTAAGVMDNFFVSNTGQSRIPPPRSAATIDFDPTGELAASFGFSGGSYAENASGGLNGSIGVTMVSNGVASCVTTQTESLAAGEFVNGESFTVGAFFKKTADPGPGQNRLLSLGLDNGGSDDLVGMPFSSLYWNGASYQFSVRAAGAGEPTDSTGFSLTNNGWYYFETTISRPGDTNSTALDYAMAIATADSAGNIGSVLHAYSVSSSAGVNTTELNQGVYACFKGQGGTAVLDDFYLSSIGLSQLPAPPPPGLTVTGANFVGPAFQLAVTGFDTFRQYQLQRWTNLAVGVSTAVGSATTPVSETGTMTDPSPPGGRAFYRVAQAAAPKPNIIVILMDDLGYNDLGVQTYPDTTNYHPNVGPAPAFNLSSPDPQIPQPNRARLLTPNIDTMAAQGLRMTSFHSSPKCSPTRASLLTGRYDQRVNINIVFTPTTASGLNSREVTLPEALREQGYGTCMVGKWHLGYFVSAPNKFQLGPTRHGFEEFLGVPHGSPMGNFDLIENETVLFPDYSAPAQQATLSWRFTERAIDFMQRQVAVQKPFFIYLAHWAPHVPIYPSDQVFTNADGTTWPQFQGASVPYLGTNASSYYDAVMEADHSVKRILDKLNEFNIATNTVVIFTSDNGPWLRYANNPPENIDLGFNSVGSAYPLRDSKLTTWEGGCRVPFIVRWPGRIPVGTVSGEAAGMVDLFPTLVGLAGGQRPTDRTLDGINLWPLWSNEPGWQSPRMSYALFEQNGSLGAVIKGDWKLRAGKLYNLTNDIQESVDLAASQPVKLAELQAAWNAVNASIAAENQSRGVYTAFETQLSTNTVTVPAGSTANFQVRLSANPGSSVTVQVGRFSGDPGIAVSANATLVCNSANWSAWQTVTLAADVNTNAVSGGATFRVTSPQIDAVREVFAFRQ